MKHATRNAQALDLEVAPALDGGAERLLWAAVIGRAIEDARGNGDREKDRSRLDLRLEALDWIMSETERPFGFRWAMAAVGLGGDSIRQARRDLLRELGGFADEWRRRRGEAA